MPRQTDHSDREILRSWSVSQSRGKFLVQRLGLTTLRTSRRRTLNSRRISWPSLFLSSWSNFHSITRRSAVSVTPSVCAVVPGIGNKTRTVEISLIPTVAAKNRKRPGQDRTINLLGIGVVGKRLNSVVKSRIRWPLKAALSPGVQPNGTFSYYYLLSILAFLVWEGFTFTGFLALWWPATGAGFAYKLILWVSRTDSSNKEKRNEIYFDVCSWVCCVGWTIPEWVCRRAWRTNNSPSLDGTMCTIRVKLFLHFFSCFRRLSILIRFLAWLTWISANRPSSLHSGMKVSPVGADFLPSPPALPTPPAWWVSFNRRAVRWANRRSDIQRFSAPVKITNQPPQVKREERKRMSRWICCCC